MRTLEGTATGEPDHGSRPRDGRTESGDTLVRLQAALAEAAHHASGDLAMALLTDDTREDLVAVLAQFEPSQALLVLAQVAAVPVPDGHTILTGLLAAGPSDAARALWDGLAAQMRQALLGRIFSPSRVRTLKRACRTLTKEP